MTPEEKELSDLKKRIRTIEMENDILKKSAEHHFQERIIDLWIYQENSVKSGGSK